MYEALKTFTMRNPEGELVKLRRGDVARGFERLPVAYQQAALEMHQVRVRPADAALNAPILTPTVEDVREQQEAAMQLAAQVARDARLADEPAAEAAKPLLTCAHCSFETRSAAGFKMHCDRKHP